MSVLEHSSKTSYDSDDHSDLEYSHNKRRGIRSRLVAFEALIHTFTTDSETLEAAAREHRIAPRLVDELRRQGSIPPIEEYSQN